MIEHFSQNLDSLRHFIYLLSLHLPRALIFVFFLPLLGKGISGGGFIKIAVCGVLLLAPVSTLLISYDRPPILPPLSLLTAISEIVIGSLLGLTMAIPYYIIKAYGAFIDVYRGATFAAQASGFSDTGGEELPLETLFGLLYTAIVLAGPGLTVITSHLLDSYLLLPPGVLDVTSVEQWARTLIALIAEHVTLAFILSAPILIIILLVEVIMQIVSAFTPQMQIYSLQFGFRSVAAIAALLLFLNFAEQEIFNILGQQSDALTTLMEGFSER